MLCEERRQVLPVRGSLVEVCGCSDDGSQVNWFRNVEGWEKRIVAWVMGSTGQRFEAAEGLALFMLLALSKFCPKAAQRAAAYLAQKISQSEPLIVRALGSGLEVERRGVVLAPAVVSQLVDKEVISLVASIRADWAADPTAYPAGLRFEGHASSWAMQNEPCSA